MLNLSCKTEKTALKDEKFSLWTFFICIRTSVEGSFCFLSRSKSSRIFKKKLGRNFQGRECSFFKVWSWSKFFWSQNFSSRSFSSENQKNLYFFSLNFCRKFSEDCRTSGFLNFSVVCTSLEVCSILPVQFIRIS